MFCAGKKLLMLWVFPHASLFYYVIFFISCAVLDENKLFVVYVGTLTACLVGWYSQTGGAALQLQKNQLSVYLAEDFFLFSLFSSFIFLLINLGFTAEDLWPQGFMEKL